MNLERLRCYWDGIYIPQTPGSCPNIVTNKAPPDSVGRYTKRKESRVNYRKAISRASPKEKENKEGKVIIWGGLQIAEERGEVESKGERERYIQLNTEFQRIARRDKKAFFQWTVHKIRKKTTERERLEISSGKLEISREHFTQR